MNTPESRALASETYPTVQRRAAGAVLVAAAAIFFLAELIAAAAWTDPPYSYTYHYISNLGVRGPSEALGQAMNSPLAWVMNTGFFLFGTMALAGVVMLRGLRGWRRGAALVPAAALAAGGVLLAFFPGSAEAMRDGTDAYHGLGAMAAIVGGNVLAIVLGRVYRLIGVPRKSARAMVLLGVFGLVSLVVFFAVAGSDANLIGLVERCAVYPLLIALALAGLSTMSTPAVRRRTVQEARSERAAHRGATQ
ncbi:DUF998 domain-containing protein [Promicromonospora sp. NFX87]|uniref:DUF998 domain-containing protein n=1 Tax=Promicromonospora sp. NFX87 TaxID=3402691 RepID=UPI003AFB12A5